MPWCAAILLAALVQPPLQAQVIDFETLPDGTPTTDEQPVFDEYAAFGVSFVLVDTVTGEPIGQPQIAKASSPRTAFNGCYDYDLPHEGQGLGSSFLTDNNSIGVAGDLLILYSPPVSRTSGVIIDIDCRTNGGPPCEQWTITARDADDASLGTIVLDGPEGASRPDCMESTGPGDAMGFAWSFDLPGPQIASVLLKYTGLADGVGLAFDNFSIATLPAPLEANVAGPVNESCAGQTVELLAEVSGGYAPYAYQWQEEVAPGSWTDLGTDRGQLVAPSLATSYRVIVTDGTLQESTSGPFLVDVVSGSGEPACDGRLLVTSNNADSVLRYDPVTMSFVDVFVAAGSGGLNGPSGLDFGPGGYLFVVSQLTHSVLRYDGQTGDFVDVFVPGGSGGLRYPVGLEVGADGHLYVSSSDDDSVKRYDGQTGDYLGDFVSIGSGGLDNPTGLVFGPDGRLYVSSRLNHAVKRYDGLTGAFVSDFVPSGVGNLAYPRGLTFGPDGALYVGSQTTDNVKRFDGRTGQPLGNFVATGSGTLNRSNDLVFGRAGNLFVASSDNDKVLRYGGRSGAFIDGFPTGNGLDLPAFLTWAQYCGDAVCDPGLGEHACNCVVDCGSPPALELVCDDGLDDECDGAVDCADSDCAAEPSCSPAGAVPDGRWVPGTMLTMEKGPGGQIIVNWDASCRSGDIDYEVYEGWIGVYGSHVPVTCSTSGALTRTFTPAPASTYDLVAPHNGVSEGSYGRDSGGVERPPSLSACMTQIAGPCD